MPEERDRERRGQGRSGEQNPTGAASLNALYIMRRRRQLGVAKQSPRLWAGTLTAWLLSYGFVAASSTDCLFILHAGVAYIYLAYWVDDMLLVSNCDDTRKKFEKAIMDPKTGFKVTCEGTASWFLGFQIKQHVTQLHDMLLAPA